MLDEQKKTIGKKRLTKKQLWKAIQRAKDNLIDWYKEKWGIVLEKGRPILLQARRISDYKFIVFINQLPGRVGLRGVEYTCTELEKGGLGFLTILAGKAHENDALGQAWMYQVAGWVRKLKGKLLFSI